MTSIEPGFGQSERSCGSTVRRSFHGVRLQVLGDYTRQNKSKDQVDKFIKQIKSIASNKTDDHFFNVEDERALITIVDALGSKIFALEGENGFILYRQKTSQ